MFTPSLFNSFSPSIKATVAIAGSSPKASANVSAVTLPEASAIVANFSISNSNGEEEILSPELRIYNQPVIATSEADIKTTLMSDKFIVINLVQNQDFFNVRYQVKPFMLWIWLSVLLISFGGIISFVQKRS